MNMYHISIALPFLPSLPAFQTSEDFTVQQQMYVHVHVLNAPLGCTTHSDPSPQPSPHSFQPIMTAYREDILDLLREGTEQLVLEVLMTDEEAATTPEYAESDVIGRATTNQEQTVPDNDQCDLLAVPAGVVVDVIDKSAVAFWWCGYQGVVGNIKMQLLEEIVMAKPASGGKSAADALAEKAAKAQAEAEAALREVEELKARVIIAKQREAEEEEQEKQTEAAAGDVEGQIGKESPEQEQEQEDQAVAQQDKETKVDQEEASLTEVAAAQAEAETPAEVPVAEEKLEDTSAPVGADEVPAEDETTQQADS
eukprot:m.119581 g.119581  ORF g.119581 m.119581 type:complete len:311 (+) comp13678_c0_seq1:1153-2085(+)